jgi:hypothetical protein
MARASVLISGSAVRVCGPMAMVTVRSGRRVRTSFLIVTPVASLICPELSGQRIYG